MVRTKYRNEGKARKDRKINFVLSLFRVFVTIINFLDEILAFRYPCGPIDLTDSSASRAGTNRH